MPKTNGEGAEELITNVRKDKTINKLEHLVTQRNILLIAIIMVIIFLCVFSGVQCQQNAFYRKSMKLRYLSTYQVEQKIMQRDRKKDAMEMTMAIMLDYQPKLNERLCAEVAEMIYDTGERIYRVSVEEWNLLFSVESEWKRKALSPSGARGLGQLMPLIGRLMAKELGIHWRGVTTLYEYKNNVAMSMKWYHYLKAQYKVPELYITLYFWGEKHGGQFVKIDSQTGDVSLKKKLYGKYRKYFYTTYPRIHKHLESILKCKIIIPGLYE